MQITPQSVWEDIQTIKQASPLIHNITNFVVMESSANGLLAIGASPFMSTALEEVDDIINIANALVLNIGTLSAAWIESMMAALKAANAKGIPVLLDPVGAGASSYRTETAFSLMEHGTVTAIRGNASEIVSLFGQKGATKGVDSLLNTFECQNQAKALAAQHKAIVWMSGQTDVITDGNSCLLVHNGHPLMSKVTGTGCMASALTAAFLAVNQNALAACTHTAILMGIAGELAVKQSKGPASFRELFIDKLYSLSLQEIEERMCAESL